MIYALRDARSLPQVFEVQRREGVEDLLQSIPVELKASERERLAVVLDADKDIEKRWRRLSALSARAPGLP